MQSNELNVFHEECYRCDHSRNCINGVYCMKHKMYVQHIAWLPCKRLPNKEGGGT